MFDLDKLYTLAESRLKEAGLSVPRRGLLKEAADKTDFLPLVAGVLNEAMSASDFPNVTANVQNKFNLPEYKYPLVNTYEPYVSKRTIKDFKPVLGVRTTEYGQFPQIPGQFAEAMRFTSENEEAVTYGVSLYGARVEHLWHLLVNDDLDAFGKKLEKLVRAAWRTKAALVAGIFNNNPNYDVDGIATFANAAWPAGHANDPNLLLTAANLTTAQGQLRAQRDANNNPIIISKYYLIVCPALEQTANQLWFQGGGGTALMTDRTSATMPIMFVEMGMQKPIVNPFLTGTTAWFLVADPNDVPFIEVGALQGLENPMLLTARGHWNETVLGIQLDQNFTSQHGCLITHGQDVLDPRAAVRGHN
jgi:hypothetical protein